MPVRTDNFIPPQPPDLPGSLFDSTRRAAGQTAARFAGERYRRILDHLHFFGPSCIFEVARGLGCFAHQISGRFGELEKADLIRKAGQRRRTETGCEAEVYTLTTIGVAWVNEKGGAR